MKQTRVDAAFGGVAIIKLWVWDTEDGSFNNACAVEAQDFRLWLAFSSQTDVEDTSGGRGASLGWLGHGRVFQDGVRDENTSW